MAKQSAKKQAQDKKNLTAHNFKNIEEASRAGKKGGRKSAEVRRRKAEIKETLALIMSLPLTSKEMADIEKIKSAGDMVGANITVQEAIILAQARKAIEGDTRAADLILKLAAGDADAHKEINVTIDNKLMEYAE